MRKDVSNGEVEFLKKYEYKKVEDYFNAMVLNDHKGNTFRFKPDLVVWDSLKNQLVIVEYKDKLPLLSTGRNGGKAAIDAYQQRYKEDTINGFAKGSPTYKRRQTYYRTLGFNHSIYRAVAIRKAVSETLLCPVKLWIVDPESDKHPLKKQRPERNQKTVRSIAMREGIELMSTGEYEKRFKVRGLHQLINLPYKKNLKIL